jgi:hypothetical protein
VEVPRVGLPAGIQLTDAPVPLPKAKKGLHPAIGCLGFGGAMLVFAAALTPSEKASPPRPAHTETAQTFKESAEHKKERLAREKSELAEAEKMRKRLAREKVDRDKRLAVEKVKQAEADKLAATRAMKTFHDSFYLRSNSSEAEEYSRYIVGEVENVSGRSFSYVQVEISLFDETKALVGSTLANVNNLEPGGVWKFRALNTEDRSTHYKVKDISGW